MDFRGSSQAGSQDHSLKIYSANFENPDCKDDPKEIVAKLVRMGVLEEPLTECAEHQRN